MKLIGNCDGCEWPTTGTYLWTVERDDGIQEVLDEAKTTTGLNNNNLVINKGVLKDSHSYKFKLQVTWTTSGITYVSSAMLVLGPNLPPSGGSCVIDTSIIRALEEEVSVIM